jgi:response regulator RpfG family c-di-GMP phosphodiesterase
MLQAVVIGLGWFGTLHLAKADVSAKARERFVDEVSRGLEQFNKDLSRTVSTPVQYGTASWEAAQSLVEQSALPRGAMVVLLDRSGRVLCHPSLRTSPNLRSVDYSDVLVRLHESEDVVALGGIKPGAVLTGDADMLVGTVAVAVTYNAGAQARVVAFQAPAELAAMQSRLTSGFTLWGSLAGVTILGVSLIGSVLLVRRHDSILARANERLEAEVERRTRRGLSIRNGLVFGLAKLADYRDTDTGKHLERICRYCELLADQLHGKHPEIERAWIDRLKLASSMHDIGKVGIPDAILLKPGPLTPDERQLMELHPIIGADTLVAIRKRVGDDDLLNMAIQVTLSHHERFDGKGYPYGLSGEQIPLSARIVALADIYDAVTSERVYRKPMTHEQAVGIIHGSRGTHLDPIVVDAFLRVEHDFNDARLNFALGAGSDELPHLVVATERLLNATRKAAA